MPHNHHRDVECGVDCPEHRMVATASANPTSNQRLSQIATLFRPYIDIVFDGPSGHRSPRFIEVEDDQGRSIRAGEWIEPEPDAEDEYWRLRILPHVFGLEITIPEGERPVEVNYEGLAEWMYHRLRKQGHLDTYQGAPASEDQMKTRYHRKPAPIWGELTQDDREFWVHEAKAYVRAMERGGFQTPTEELGPLEKVRWNNNGHNHDEDDYCTTSCPQYFTVNRVANRKQLDAGPGEVLEVPAPQPVHSSLLLNDALDTLAKAKELRLKSFGDSEGAVAVAQERRSLALLAAAQMEAHDTLRGIESDVTDSRYPALEDAWQFWETVHTLLKEHNPTLTGEFLVQLSRAAHEMETKHGQP